MQLGSGFFLFFLFLGGESAKLTKNSYDEQKYSFLYLKQKPLSEIDF